ncbi:hypothetical protein OOT46_05640 [Aquabacterium sp. A7-Y]|uniref:hypothetical protein n=1 Tax=Aquabacterium sp. A7-Y TaxID=1349605 RepID=UPI00223E70D6|nr:hypothetical protein [Aquabacterium sp. A7-Y]MCW7537334.1 hypothetical protein [Aquabacterium sp. A7-Y]
MNTTDEMGQPTTRARRVEQAVSQTAARLPLARQHSPATCGLPLFALIDPFFREPHLLASDTRVAGDVAALQTMRREGWRREVWMPEGQPLIHPLRLPYLVQLDGKADEHFPLLLETTEREAEQAVETGVGKFTIGAVLESELAPELLMQWVEAMWTVQIGPGNRYLRIADPRVFELLTHLLGVGEMQNWLGPIARWHVRTRDGVWVSHAGAVAIDSGCDEQALYSRQARLQTIARERPRLKLSPERKRRMEASELVSLSLTELQRHRAGPLPEDSHERAWRGLERCRELGLASADDMVAYVWRAIAWPSLEHSASCRDAIRAAASDPGTLDERLTGWNEAQVTPPDGRPAEGPQINQGWETK